MKQEKAANQLLLERMIFFSDAVFAIAITILVLDIKVPEIHDHVISNSLLWEKFSYSIPKIIGVLLSFFVIGLYWISHHKLFGYITVYNKKLLLPNLLFLLTIIFMPFTTSFLSEYYNPGLTMPVILYSININLSGLASYHLWSVGTSATYNLSTISQNSVLKKYNKARALTIPFVFLLVILLSFISGWIPFLILPFIPVVTYFIKRYFRKNYKISDEEL